MYVLYVDESYDRHNFVLCGVAALDTRILWASQKLDALERRLFPDLSDLEKPIRFHCSAIWNAEAILSRPKAHGKDIQLAKLVEGWSRDKRLEIFQAIYGNILAEQPLDLTVFAIIVRSSAWPNAGASAPDGAVYDWAFQELYATFNAYLMRHYQGRVNPQIGLVGHGQQKGFIVMDQNAREEALKGQARAFRSIGTVHAAAINIVEAPAFMASEDCRFLQYADFCSNAILRAYRPEPENDDGFFLSLIPRFDIENWDRHGLLHVSPQDCDCPSTRHYRELM